MTFRRYLRAAGVLGIVWTIVTLVVIATHQTQVNGLPWWFGFVPAFGYLLIAVGTWGLDSPVDVGQGHD